MLHELLLALVGCTGDVFMDVKEQARALGLTSPKDEKGESEEMEDNECTFRLAPDITFLEDSERWAFFLPSSILTYLHVVLFKPNFPGLLISSCRFFQQLP